MERLAYHFIPLLMLVPLLMSVLSYLKYKKYRKVEFLHLAEFYISAGLVTTGSIFLLPLGSAYIILSMLPWMWMLRTMGLICEDISNSPLFSRFHYFVLALGGLVSIIFLSFNFDLSIVVTPFSLGIGFIGLTFVLQGYSKGRITSYNYLEHFNLFLILLFFVTRLIFPILISNNMQTQMMGSIDSYLLIFFCASLYPLYAEVVFERHERFLEDVLHTRNKQLFGHSGFSEYRILSAGLSHEVNNAIFIINARTALMLQGKAKDTERELRIIQKAADRIVRSVRGLREFIYPHEMEEVLDLENIVKDVLELYGQRLSNHGVQVDTVGLSNKLIRGQRIQLEQVFLSLINNSVDAVDQLEEKTISISAKTMNENIHIIYQDSSASKAEQIMPLLNDPYYASYQFVDNDIRLVLAKEIIEKYGGSFRCVKQNELSTFHIIFPVADAIRSTSMELQGKIEEIRELH